MNIIVSVDAAWGIGKAGQLLLSIPEDMRWFRGHTLGKVVVMGDVTLASLPGGKPLPGRTNIVLSDNEGLTPEGATVFHSLPELLAGLQAYAKEDIFVIGGAGVYRLLLPYCQQAYITRIERSFPADRWFPDLDALEEWRLAESSEPQLYQDIQYRFCRYENLSPLPW